MINLDDWMLFFANPEAAADYLGFDLTPRRPNRAARGSVPDCANGHAIA